MRFFAICMAMILCACGSKYKFGSSQNSPTEETVPEEPKQLDIESNADATRVAKSDNAAPVKPPKLEDFKPLDCSGWQNPQNVFDVNGDSFVSPIDALVIINAIGRGGSRNLISEQRDPENIYFYDVSGDCRITAHDALLVINDLNSSQLDGRICRGLQNGFNHADIDSNGQVTEEDYEILYSRLREGSGPSYLKVEHGETITQFIDTDGNCVLDYDDLNAVGESLGKEKVFSGWQNSSNVFDVNQDKKVDTFDLAILYKELNDKGAYPLAAKFNTTGLGKVDVDGDGWLTTDDYRSLFEELSKP